MSDHHQDSHDHNAHHDDDSHESPSGLGSIFVEEKLPEPIVVDIVMQDLTLQEGVSVPTDINELQKHPSTRSPRPMDTLVSTQANDLSTDREEHVMPIEPTRLQVYDDGSHIISDRVDSADAVRLARDSIDSSEGFLVDARRVLPHTRETVDMFVPSRSIQSEILRSLKIPIEKVVQKRLSW